MVRSADLLAPDALRTLARVTSDVLNGPSGHNAVSSAAAPIVGAPMRLDAAGDLLTVADLAALLSCSHAALYERVRRGQIPRSAIVRIGRSLRFDRVEIGRWLKRAVSSEARR